MILILFIIITIIALFLSVNDCLGHVFIWVIIVIAAGALSIALGIAAIIVNFPVNVECKKIELQTTYDTLVYELKNGETTTLTRDIAEYNTEISTGRMMQNDFWVGIFNPNIYDELPLIEVNEK